MGEESDDDSTPPEPAVRRIDGEDAADSPADGEDGGVGDPPADADDGGVSDSLADADDGGISDSLADDDDEAVDDPSSDAEASVTPPTATDDMFNEIDTRPTLERDSTDPDEPDDESASSEEDRKSVV